MFTNAVVTITRRGVTYSQSTGRRTAQTAKTVLQNAPCLVTQSKTTRQKFTDGIREMTKPVMALLIETYEDITIEAGDQAEITMRTSTSSDTYTINDAIKSVGIRFQAWKCDIERIKVPASE